MKMMKHGLTIALVAMILVSVMAFPAFAEEENRVVVRVEAVSETKEISAFDTMDVLNGMQKSTSKPKSYWDLGDESYSATLTQVGTNYLYTNYYFHCNSDGELYVDVDVKSEGSGTMIVGVYNITDKKDEGNVSFATNADGVSRTVQISNLSSEDHYAIYFCSQYNGTNVVYMTGSAVVYH